MNLPVKQTSRDVSIPATKRMESYQGFFWSMGLIVSALYQLGIFALKRGGTVEFQCGPLKYKVNGRMDRELDRGSSPRIDLS